MAKIIILLCVLLMVGCSTPIIKTSAQETLVPVIYCPAPPTIDRPTLPIHDISSDRILSDGDIVKYYNASMVLLIGYAVELENALNQYQQINTEYNKMQQQIIPKD